MSFDKVLIANRGEIACRVIRACRGLGLASVAVYSDADVEARHVSLADQAVHIGPAEARASYLDIDAVIQAARVSGAGAIHPGYGFLSENADFARACEQAGIVFVGPSPGVIEQMGGKIQAKRIAEQAGVACVPGYHGDAQDAATLQTEAERIGTPLLIKASAGGGGRGMRRVDDLTAFNEQLRLAQDEARAAFGNPQVLLEKYIAAPRHIEVQILADRHGNLRHLFERDCSVQRNYQKVIEEAPAPNLSPATRHEICAAAVALAEWIGYDSAGTVEFVYDAAAQAAYFLEMNTRLQVEHPVTELVTGIDLAQWQLRIAGGDAIDFQQAEVRCEGWAVEARIAAEDPAAGYAPQTGHIVSYIEPELPGLRIDSGVGAGSHISAYYDSMLAKVIAHAPDRNAAIRKLRLGLGGLQIGGLRLNTPFLRDVLNLEEFRAGRHVTSLLERAWPDGWKPAASSDLDCAHAALVRHLSIVETGPASPWTRLGAWRLGESAGQAAASTYYLREPGRDARETSVAGRGGSYRVAVDGVAVLRADAARLQDEQLGYVSEGLRSTIAVVANGLTVGLPQSPSQPVFEVLQPEQALLGTGAAVAAVGNSINAPTPGQIAEVLVGEGDAVAAGQPVLVLEAMKMLQQLCASQDGTIKKVCVAVGDVVNSGDLLAELDDPDQEPQASGLG